MSTLLLALLLDTVREVIGSALGWTTLTIVAAYWFKYIITTPNQLTAAAIVIQFWVSPDRVNPGVFIAIFLV
jgi:amino acid transporter